MACHQLSAAVQSAVSLRQGQKDTEGRTESHILSTPLPTFYTFSSLSSNVPHNSTSLMSWSSEVGRFHFYPSLEKTSVSHVKYHAWTFSSFFFFLSLPKQLAKYSGAFHSSLFSLQFAVNSVPFYSLVKHIPSLPIFKLSILDKSKLKGEKQMTEWESGLLESRADEGKEAR